MRGRACRVVTAVAGLGALAFSGGCAEAPTRPEATGQTRAVEIHASVGADGLVQVTTGHRFASSAGVVELWAPVLAIIDQVRLDGNPRSITVTQYPVEMQIRRPEATVEYRLSGGVERYDDVAVLTLPVWGVPSDASGADAPVPVTGTLELPAPPVADGVYLHGALDPQVSIDGQIVRFEGRLASPRDSELVAVIPSEAVPGVILLPGGTRATDVLDRQAEAARRDGTFRGEIDDRRRREDLLAAGYWGLVGVESGFPFLVAAPRIFRNAARRRRALKDVPKELMDAPGKETPAVVALLARDGHDIGWEAVAGTVLHLADRGVFTLDGVTSDQYEVRISAGASGDGPGEQALLTALRDATPADGRLSGPPLHLDPKGAWWPTLRRDTLVRAKAGELIHRRYPSGVFLTAVVLLTGTTFPLWARSPEAAVGGLVVAGILFMLPFVGGYVLTTGGHRVRAQWEAFGRRAAAASEIETAPPRAVSIWGPYLVYGAALGLARVAIADLTPLETTA